MLRQYDLSRAIPRHVRDVTVFKGDILTLTTSQGRVFSSGVDGSLRCFVSSRPYITAMLSHSTVQVTCWVPHAYVKCCQTG